MDFDLSKTQKLLKDTARQFLARECNVRRLLETGGDALWPAIADQGWTGLIVPEEYGGLGTGVVELAVVAEEMGRACLPGPFLSNLFATALIRAAGSPEQQARWLPPIASGHMKATVAILEATASWDLDSIRMTAPGKKLFVGDAASADVILCVARSRDGVATFAVPGVGGPPPRRGPPPGAPTLTIERMPSMDETRKLYEVTFDRLGSDVLPGGRDAVRSAIDVATVALCAEMVGGMQWVLDTTVEYAKTRQQFGRPIGSFQAVQHQCADMLLLTESARSATYYAAWALTENDPAAPLAVSMAKAYCSDACREVGNRGVQVHGGIGFTWEHDLQLYYKRAKSSETTFGDAAFHRERIAALVVDELPHVASRTETSPDHETVRA
jgi:alkylation response protein AidB-like acyl-CoA dehydrogenase